MQFALVKINLIQQCAQEEVSVTVLMHVFAKQTTMAPIVNYLTVTVSSIPTLQHVLDTVLVLIRTHACAMLHTLATLVNKLIAMVLLPIHHQFAQMATVLAQL